MIASSLQDKQHLRDAAKISTEILWELRNQLQAGITPWDLDQQAAILMKERKVAAAFRGVSQGKNKPFEHSSCISVNDVILHGIPKDIPLENGDIVKIDLGIIYRQTYYTDQCFTFVLDDFRSAADKKIVNIGRMAVETAMKKAVTGNTAGDVGAAMQTVAQLAGLSTLKHFVAHGIGKNLHEEPEIATWQQAGTGKNLSKGEVITVECQVVENEDYTVADNGWDIYTYNGSNASMFEYMVIVDDDKPEVLTKMQDWSVIV